MLTVRLLAGVLLTSGVVLAGDGPLRTARSANERYLLRIDPGRPGQAGRSCQASLYERPGPGQQGERLWQRALVNDVAPAKAFIRDDGRFLITLDEFRRGGARHALVVYGRDGELLRHFVLTDLLDPADWAHVRVERGRQSGADRRGRLVWLDGAQAAFDESDDTFTISLAWGRRICIDLKKLCVLGRQRAGVATSAPAPPPEIAALLSAPDDEPDKVPIAEQTGELSGLTSEQEAQTAAIAAELVSELTPTSAPAAGGDRPGSTPPAADAEVPVPAAAARAESGPGPAPDTTRACLVGHPVPSPDPLHKVDYVAWLNSIGQVAGPDAAPLYARAAALFVPFSGDEELLNAAARGERDALFSPQIKAWLAANAEALRLWREATTCPVRGCRYAPDAESVLEMPLPELATFRSLAKLNCLDGRRLAALGRTEQAADRFVEVLAAGTHLGQGLTFVENLMGQAVQVLGALDLLDLLAQPGADKLDYDALATKVEAAYQPVRPLAEALESERVAYLDLAQRFWDADPHTGELRFNEQKADHFLAALLETDVDRQPLLRQLAAEGFQQTVAVGNAYYDALTAAMRLPYAEARPRIAEVQALLESENLNPLLRHGMVDAIPYARMAMRVEAIRRATTLVTRLKAYHQRHGEYPATLAALDRHDLAQDPFSAAPLVYQRVGQDFRLYSVGANLTDDGGVHDRRGVEGDLCFWPPPAR